ncbi:MAG TPA: hypothetical protein PLA68_18090, partial [Panacibacter sp.]|nr:hypothetical protein [Panacibacter sp.]
LPLVFIAIAIEKVVVVFTKIISPLAIKLGIDNIAGKATVTILIVIIVLFICFFGGLLMKIRKLQKLNEALDKKLMELVPSYSQIKEKAADRADAKDEVSAASHE